MNRHDTLSRLKSAAPVAVATADRPLVRFEPIQSNGHLIPAYQPAGSNIDAADWIRHNRETVDANLLKQGSLVFRGFDIYTPAALERFCLSLADELFADNGEHPRGNLSEHVYTP